jgi:hypothetical protein
VNELDEAVKSSPQSIHTIRTLVEAHPDVVMVADECGAYPLHWACGKSATLESIKCLHQAWPQVIKERVSFIREFLPLHLACAAKCSFVVIQYVANAWPEAINMRDREEMTPLDRARDVDLDNEVIQWLEALRTQAATKKAQRKTSVASDAPAGTPPPVSQFEEERAEIRKVIDGERDEPVPVSLEYVEEIMTSWTLGRGFFGVVYRGMDSTLGEKFAIKAIDRDLLLHGHTADLQRVKDTFEKEQKVRWTDFIFTTSIHGSIAWVAHSVKTLFTDTLSFQASQHCPIVCLFPV